MAEQKKRKDRSPRYPSLSLREAVEKIGTLYEREKRAMVPAVVAVKSWGYNTLNGRSLTMLAAITQYGLLARQNNSVGISDDAFTIIEAPRTSRERQEVLLRCARSPGIFDDLLQRYPNGLPSDETLRWDLKQKSFTDQGAEAAIACLRDTVSFVNLETGDYTGGNEHEDQEQSRVEKPPMPQSVSVNPSSAGVVAGRSVNTSIAPISRPGDWVFPVGEGTVSLSWSGVTPTADALDALKAYLDVFKMGFKGADKKATNEQGPPVPM